MSATEKKPNSFHWDMAIAGLVPTMVWFIVFLVLPLMIIFVYSFWRSIDFQMVMDWTLDNYREIWKEEMYRRVFIKIDLANDHYYD